MTSIQFNVCSCVLKEMLFGIGLHYCTFKKIGLLLKRIKKFVQFAFVSVYLNHKLQRGHNEFVVYGESSQGSHKLDKHGP